MTLRYFLDEDLSFRVAEGLRRSGVDALSVHEIERANRSIPDEEQLAFAASEGRVLVTYNRADFQALDGHWHAVGRNHAGIIWCSERTILRSAIGDLVRALEAVATQHASLDGLCLPLSRARE